MKKFYTALLFCSMLAGMAMAQDKSSGIIYFDQVIDMKALAGGGNATFSMGGAGAPAMPDKFTNKFELLFSPAGAKFQKSAGDDAGGMMVRIASTNDLFFKDDKVIESFELDGEPLLTENKLGYSTLNPVKSDETKMIAGFTCKKATVDGMNNSKLTIWYTTDLNFKASPMAQIWTDGVVLGIENDRMKMYATTVEYSKVKDSEFALPKKAVMLTKEEADKKRADYREKLLKSNGATALPGGAIRVMRTN